MMTKTKADKYPQRVRNELRFRELTVLRVERAGAAFQRIVLGGEALEGFASHGFDDHTKLFFPEPGAAFTPPQVTAIVTIADASYKDYLADLDGFNIEWVVGHNPAFVAERLAQVKVPAEDYFIWLTGEGAVVKSLLARFEDESIDQQLVRSQAYWHSK